MATLFDYLTVACFLFMVSAFFTLTTREPRTLAQLLLAGISFAIANQLGNAGYGLLALIIVVTGATYAAIIVWQRSWLGRS